MSNNSVQTITHESGQLGMFFGGKTELEKFAEKYNNINRADFILTTAKDFLIDTPLSVPSTVIQRFKANVSAIRTLKELRGRHSVATTTEQQKLASYSGWGAVSAVFNENNAKFTNRRNEVKDLLTQAEYESARTSILSSFYTPLYLTKAIYTMLKQVGFKGGAITDPAAGVGGLISAMPKEMFNSSKITLIELDNLTAEALDHLYPSATVYNKGFETVKQQDNQDLIIQNPPFGSAKISDPLDSDLNGLTLHNYFMAKSIKSLRTGGLMVAIVSTSFLDSKNNKSRSLVGDLAELKGAIRLPKSVFLEHSGASASVDILLFQRTDKTASKLQSWIEAHETTTTTGDDFYLNNYYLDNPDAILGVMEVQKGIKGKQTHCISESKNIIGDIQKAMLNHFPTDIYKKVKKSVAISDPNTSQSDNELLTPISDTVTNDSYIVAGGYAVTDSGFIATRLIDNENGAPQYNIHQDIKGKRLERISMMVSVKQAMAELLELERTDANESDIEDARELLNDTYDAFVKRNGYFQESANRRAFSNDSFYANLSSLEVDFDAGLTREQAKRLSLKAYKPSSKKAEIFTSRVIKPWTAPTSADNSTDALWIVWNDSRVIDLPRIASMCAKSMIEVENEIVGSQVFLNPETNEYEFAETYLSGDVKHKFKLVESLLLGNPKLKVNYKKLKEILPKDIPAVDIKVELSAGWLPNKVVTEFLQYILQTTNVIAEHTLGQWHVAATSIPSLIDTKRFGLEEYPSSKVISRMMAGKDLLVYKTNPSGSRYIDKEATMQIEAITNEITTLFADWIWKDEARRESLEALYNDLYNRFVAPVYSGENLAFPDQSTQITLRPHQKTAVRRALEQGSFLMNYAVGSGKTMAFASIVHEWHRLGLKERTAVVLPNHLVESIAIEWLRLYPLENLLVLNPIDMSASKRRETLNRVKTGSKIVLIPETTFKAIPLPFETEQEIIREEISETRHAISILHKNFSIKSLEKKLINLEFDLNALTNRKSKDETLDFKELGFDSIIVDEAQIVKNKKLNTVALTNVRGVNTQGSQRSWDMYVKTRYLNKEHAFSGVIFSTGTPLSNSIIELYTMQTFLSYDLLKSKNLHWVDNWASIYSTCSSEFEVDATGANFKPVTRLRSFDNLAELKSMFACIAETVTQDQLKELLPKIDNKYSLLPPLAGGKPQTVFVEPSQEQQDYISRLVRRAQNLKSSEIRNDNMLLVMFHARCASLDLRILDPSAPENPNSKAVACANRVAEIYKQYEAEKGTQLIFCDLSVPNKAKKNLRAKITKLMEKASLGDDLAQRELETIGSDQIEAINNNFSVYDNIKQLLLDRGIKESEIAYAQDYKTPKAKAELYLQLNNGVKRVAIASTALMGTGANVNKRGVAIHHLDPTYKPSCLSQRTGRHHRQGCEIYEKDPANFEGINVIYYATNRSLDGYLFQTLQNKASWIEAFFTENKGERTAEDLSGESITFAEIKAEVSGNKLVLEHLKLTKSIHKLSVQQKRHASQQHDYQNSIKKNNGKVVKIKQDLLDVKSDIEKYNDNAPIKGVFSAMISGFEVDKFSMAAKMLKTELQNFNSRAKYFQENSHCVMSYCGFDVEFYKSYSDYYILIKGVSEYYIRLSKGMGTSETSILYSIVNTLKDLHSELNDRKHELIQLEKNIEVAKSEIGKPFSGLDLLIKEKRRLIEIKSEIMEAEGESNK